MKSAPDIERLIASAYSGLGPSASVEESIRAALPADRAQPVRRGPGVALLAVLALIVFGVTLARARRSDDGLAGEGEKVPNPALVTRPPCGVVAEDGDGIRVRLCRDGRILVPSAAGEWRQLSLAELATHLGAAAEAFDKREAAAGRSGFETTAPGVNVSRLRVDLIADRDAPWLHLQWIMTVCAERRVPRVAFAVRDSVRDEGRAFKLDASLPTDPGLVQKPQVRVSVLIRSGKPVRYVFDGQESEELASVARYLAAARKAAEPLGAPVRGELKAGAGTAFHEVAKLLAEFRQAGYEHVDFYGTAVPDADVRAAPELPAPEHDWPSQGDETRGR